MSLRKRLQTFTILCLVAVLLVVLSVQPAGAYLIHDYSVAADSNNNPVYTGVRVYRTDNHFNLPGSNCNDSFTTPVVYQTQWAVITLDALNWIELGTGHKCSNYRFWFWGYGWQGGWFPQGTASNRAIDNHTFSISRKWNGGNPLWEYIVDTTVMGGLYWNTGAAYVQAGYETYESTAVAAAHGYMSMRFHIYDANWVAWSGRDGTNVSGGLCGRWAANDDWRASQNWGSC